MEPKLIKIEIDEQGQAEIKASGFKGGECKSATKAFENMYTDKTVTNTAEFYQAAGAPGEVVILGQ